MNTNESTSETPHHECRDSDVASLMMVAGLLLIGGLVVILACFGLLRSFKTKDDARQGRLALAQQQSAQFPEPRLQVQSTAALEKLRAVEEQELNSYGWVDRPNGIVRIPIERAMELIAQRGLPEVGANKTPLQLMQERPQQDENPSPPPKRE